VGPAIPISSLPRAPACAHFMPFGCTHSQPICAVRLLRLGVLTVLKVLNTHQRFIVCADQPAFRWRGRGGSA
jgi:hypothetical protein